MNGCSGVVEGHGLCNKHYKRWQKYGDPTVTKCAPKGAGSINGTGYRQVHRTDSIEIEHTAIVERVLGKKLPRGAEVHHFNEIRSDNRHANLVVCPSRAYHQLLHVRQRALAACGNANWRHCKYCKRYDDPVSLTRGSRSSYHAECRNQRDRAKNKDRKARAAC